MQYVALFLVALAITLQILTLLWPMPQHGRRRRELLHEAESYLAMAQMYHSMALSAEPDSPEQAERERARNRCMAHSVKMICKAYPDRDTRKWAAGILKTKM